MESKIMELENLLEEERVRNKEMTEHHKQLQEESSSQYEKLRY